MQDTNGIHKNVNGMARSNERVALQTRPKSIKVPQRVLAEVAKAIESIQGWGSVEIYIQNFKVTQITERNIKKTDGTLYVDEEFMS